MNTRDPVRARAARATWAPFYAVLLAAVTAHAGSTNPKQENGGQELPVVATVPADEAVRVRPDTTVSFQLDTQAPEFRAFRQQLESGRFAIQVEDGSSTQLFVGADKRQTSAGEATFEARTGIVSTPALGLRRYTTYTVTLAVKAAYEALLHGKPLPGNDSVSFAFITGSALNEPTHYQLAADDVSPRVTGKARLTVVATDDYGNPAWGSSVSVRLTEDGSRLSSSAVATPAQATLPEPGGSVSFDITDREAEGVQLALQANGRYPENAWTGSAALRFRPGPPGQALLSDVPAQATVAAQLTVKGSVVDLYGNRVEDGTPVSAGGQAITTRGGSFSATLTLPSLVSLYTLEVSAGTTVLTSASIHLLPGEPAAITSISIPETVETNSTFTVCATATDAYDNPVVDGSLASVSTGSTTVSTTTSAGRFCGDLKAPSSTSTVFVYLTVYDNATSNHVDAQTQTRAVAPPPASIFVSINPLGGSIPADGTSSALLSAFVTDKYGRPVEDNLLSTWTTTLGTVTVSASRTSAGRVSALVRSSVAGTAAITVTVGSVSRTVSVTFTQQDTSVGSVGGVSYSQPNSGCSGANATYKDFGYGTYFRPRQGCSLTLTGKAYTRSGALARNAALTVTLSVDGGNSTPSTTVFTDANGNFTATRYVSIGNGLRASSYWLYDTSLGYRWVTDYWDWGYVGIVSSTGQAVFTDKLYTVRYTSPY